MQKAVLLRWRVRLVCTPHFDVDRALPPSALPVISRFDPLHLREPIKCSSEVLPMRRRSLICALSIAIFAPAIASAQPVQVKDLADLFPPDTLAYAEITRP